MNNKGKLVHQAHRYMAILIVSLAFVILVATGLIIAYNFTDEKWFLISLVIFFSLFLIIYIIICILFIRRIHTVYYDQIYKNTYNNIKKLADNDTNLKEYRNLDYTEVKELNDATLELRDRLKNSYLVTQKADYSSIGLNYLDKSRNIVDYDEFVKRLPNILFISQSFRNLLIELYYDVEDINILHKDLDRIMTLHERAFNYYSDVLYMFGPEQKSIYIYLPHIDSFSNVLEILERLRQESTIMSREAKGLVTNPAKYALVAYPYSTEEYILNDLRYAKRQNKSINLFLPNRKKNNMTRNVMMNTSMNINHISKLLGGLSLLDIDSIELKDFLKDLNDLLDELAKYLAIENAGVIKFDKVNKIYTPLAISNDSTLFKGVEIIDDHFIDALDHAKDQDSSYYFSNRKHANYELGRMIDRLSITSGFYYIVKNEHKEVIGVIYFFNKENDLVLNSYLREALYIISLRIAHVFEKINLLDTIDMLANENDYILSMSPYSLYKVDEEYRITYIARRLRKLFPNAKKNSICYKAMFNLDKPCHDCPLKTSKKKLLEVGKDTYEASLVLNDYHRDNKTIFLENVNAKGASDDLFNRDLLIYSYRALNETMNNEYISSSRGYVLLLALDNYSELLKKKGSEDLLYIIRTFIHEIKQQLHIENIYYYNPQCIAIHLPFIGHADVIDTCEVIYDISKKHVYGDINDELNITYLPISYPSGYATSQDFFSHLSEFYNSKKYERNKDYIYFYNNPISRSASKRSFILSVIEEEFSSLTTTSVNLQPLVRVKDRHIYGAEILLRINDVQRNAVFNAFEISKIAQEENKTHMITNSIINYIGSLYSDYGKSTFALNDFNRICINIDETYLKDLELIKGVSKLIKANKIPNNFISFEIPEDMIPEHIDQIKELANELKNDHVYFSVDRYTGKYIGTKLLKEVGFDEIKIDRGIIMMIDKDSVRLRELVDIVNSAHKEGLNIAAVGVENETQFNMLKGLDDKMMVQGYFLYKPLSRSDLIAAIIS